MFEKQIAVLAILFCLCISGLRAQDAPTLPQRSGTVSATQTLHFGDLTTGSSGGTVTMDYSGTRSCTGDITLLSMGSTYQEAIFEFKLCPGRTVAINYSSGNITMEGGNGGTITLKLGEEVYIHTEAGATEIENGGTFTSNSGCDDIHLIHLGGTITVGSTSDNPPGLYTGTFELTFVQQ